MLNTITELAPYLADENRARELFERLRWPSGPVCPHCHGIEKIYKITSKKARAGLYKCGPCKKQFTATVGTIFEGSHVPLSKWLYTVYLMCSSKKGVSAKQLEGELGVTYKTAWFMCHRVRYAMTQPPLSGRLGGDGQIVEVDETYIGGKRSNNRRRPPNKKQIVVALIERGGQARSFPVPSTKKGYLQSLIRLNVQETSHIMTDSFSSYRGLARRYASHQAIDHSKEYVRGIIHTNFAESYFSLLKRGIFGTFHHVSKKHLPRYLREFEFRWNRRKVTGGERMADAITGTIGKRLIYKEPIRKRGRPSKRSLARRRGIAQSLN